MHHCSGVLVAWTRSFAGCTQCLENPCTSGSFLRVSAIASLIGQDHPLGGRSQTALRTLGPQGDGPTLAETVAEIRATRQAS